VSRRSCRHLAELRSAYVDGALNASDRERLLAHLAGCPACRADVEELRSVHELLLGMGRSTAATAAPGELSTRLVSIAGSEADVPLWSRPFRRTRAGALPSGRRATRAKAAAAALALGSLVSALGVVGYAAAPSVEATALGDPTSRVRSEFASTLTQFPLTSKAMGAVMMTSRLELLASGRRPIVGRSTGAALLPVPIRSVMALLRRTARESDRVSYSGTQEVLAAQADQTISARVRIVSRADQGTAVEVYGEAGQRLVSGFVPVSASSHDLDEELLSRLERSHSVTGYVGSTVAGRAVTMVQATAGPSPAQSVRALAVQTEEPRVSARWWVDNDTGLLLWQESYDESGAVSASAGFTAITFSDKPGFMEHLAPRLATSSTTAKVGLSNVDQLASRGWSCHGALAGLSLIRLTSDETADPATLHLVYSDGVATLSVFEQRGLLESSPAGARWDGSLGAFLSVGAPTMATWQSGDRVLTVVTDGPRQLVDEAVSTLPHAEPTGRTTMERVRAGWVRVLERVVR
jgi:anti-sigma factor RsiW